MSELIKLLSHCDADAEVVLTTQPNYPMEHTVSGIALRADLGDQAGQQREAAGSAPNDVLLVEGRWLRYGDLAAWDAARPPPRSAPSPNTTK
ncbi:MAG TPA: hypothetical protein VHN14_00300 [Kofleriaceae bacterium]|nr:hypothetical protein [Kofleriaceae bacterium]